MQTSTTTALIFAKMAAVMSEIEVIGKGRSNTVQNYKFRGIDDAYNALHGPLSKHKVFYTAEVLSQEHTVGVTAKGGAQYHSFVTVRYHFFAEDGSTVAFDAVGESLDTGDKAAGKAQSYALKVALMQVFCIPTEEQKDTEYNSDQLAAPDPVQSSINYYQEQIATAQTLPELVAVWKRVPTDPPQIAAALTLIKDARKAALSANPLPAPTQ